MSIQAIHHNRQQALLASVLLNPIAQLSKEALSTWQLRRMRRKTEEALSGLSPHLLSDIHGDNEPPLRRPAEDLPFIRTFPRA